jgi:AcrR family transcriptional regulator
MPIKSADTTTIKTVVQPSKRGRRRRDDTPTPNRADLVNAVLTIEKRDGSGSLSMRKLASEVGVSARLLYTMVKNKEELYELAVNSILASWELPGPELSWQERFSTLTKTGLELCMTYPELARQALRYSLENKYPENAYRLLDEINRYFKEAGLNDSEARQVQMLLNALLLGALDLTRNYQNDEQPKLMTEFYKALDIAFAHILKGVRLG